MTRVGQEAIEYARSRIGPDSMPASGYCLQFVRTCFDVGSYYASAIDAWNGASTKHEGDRNPPPAVPLYFRTPSQYDHVVFGGDAGEIITTFNADVRQYWGDNGPDVIAQIERDFDGTYLGWTEEVSEVRIYDPTPQEEPDMTPDESQRLLNIEGAVGRLDAMWTASDGRNRVFDFDQANDWTEQTTSAVGRIETEVSTPPPPTSTYGWTPMAIIALVAFVALAVLVVAVVIISAVTGSVPTDLQRAAVYLAFLLAGGALTRLTGGGRS